MMPSLRPYGRRTLDIEPDNEHTRAALDQIVGQPWARGTAAGQNLRLLAEGPSLGLCLHRS